MRVADAKRPSGRPPAPEAMTHTFPAPRRGLVSNENVASIGPEAAQVLDNWVCTPTGIRPRAGSQKYATLPSSVRAMFAYRVGPGAMFAATDSAIYDLSTAPNPESATAVVSGLASGDFGCTMFGTAGSDFLVAANGADPVQIFNGASWQALTGASSPSITGADTSKLSHVWSYANRLFFVEKGSLTAHYLPVDSIGGEVGQVRLAGVFTLGGSLLFGANWSLDAGDGMDDKCVFVSTEGEVAVFVGPNPDLYTDWRLEGVYKIGKPLGKNASFKAGGELIIATQSGLVPLSRAINSDPSAMGSIAVSAPIGPLWRDYAGVYTSAWSVAKWPEKGILLVSPASASDDSVTLCASLETGAWSRWTGVGASALCYFSDYVFAGGRDGVVRRLETGGSDDGEAYTALSIGAHEGLGATGRQKTVLQARGLFRASHSLNPSLSAQVDYRLDPGEAPAAQQIDGVGSWDSSKWDEVVWDAPSNEMALTSYWRGIGRTGYAIAPELQLTFQSLAPPEIELVSVDVTYRVGALVA